MVPLGGTMLLSEDVAIEFFRGSLAKPPTWRASCRCLIAKFSEGYPKEIDCRQGFDEIRMRRCKEHKD